MSIQAVTFDAAHTLVHVEWNPARMAVEAAVEVGAKVDGQVAEETYNRMLQTRWRDYQELNKSDDAKACRDFWLSLTGEWLQRLGLSLELVEPISAQVEDWLLGEDSRVYHVYDDVFPCLEALKAKGLRMAVISNWDYTLIPTMVRFGLADYFEVIVPSLVFGVEKPDVRIFEHTLNLLGLEAGAVMHVGDDPMADFHGARSAGMEAMIIDRGCAQPSSHVISDLRDLVGVL